MMVTESFQKLTEFLLIMNGWTLCLHVKPCIYLRVLVITALRKLSSVKVVRSRSHFSSVMCELITQCVRVAAYSSDFC